MVILRFGAVVLLLAAGACGSEGGGPPDETAASRGERDVPAAALDSSPTVGGEQTDQAGAEPLAGSSGENGAAGAIPSQAGSAPAAAPGQSGAAAPAETAADAEAILLRAERAYDAARSLRAGFVQDLTVPLLGSSQRSRGQIFHRKPDRFLMRFSDPAGDVVVTDGSHLWMYYPSSDPGQVIRTSVGEAGRLDLQREFLSNPTERYTATLHGTETVGGRPAHALTLVPRTASPYKQVRIWIDARDHLARRFEITETNDAVRRVELQGLEVNVTLPDSLFAFTPPAGAQVFDQ